MVGWFVELNPKERQTMGACFGGWALDAFDVQMYSFVIPTVIALWGLSRGEAGLIGTVTLLISSLGGWFSGTLADRFGRVRMLQITILWYSVFTFSAPLPRTSSSCLCCERCMGWALAVNGLPERC
jgi:MFS family permease